MDRIYLDYAATTPVDQRVIDEMIPYFRDIYGNPSSIHFFGQKAEGAVENARERIKNLLNCHKYDIIFTSGGTESDNLALRGVALNERKKRNANKILISSVEHDAISTTANQLKIYDGFEIIELRVDNYGLIDQSFFESQLNEQTAIVSIIYGNNEIGTINPIEHFVKECNKKGIPFHTDAVQALPHIKVNMESSGIDLLSFGAHKFYGPKGVGALIKKKGLNLIPQNTGGKQEEGYRAGTHNVPYILGMTKALEILTEEKDLESRRQKILRDQLINFVINNIRGAYLTGDPVSRLPNHASFVFDGIKGNELLISLDIDGFAVSAGSACKVGLAAPSKVLLKIGIDEKLAMGSLRVTLGKNTLEGDIDKFERSLRKIIDQLRRTTDG
ncbi:MAG: cysteine desulfurase family protein [Chloroflexi bacterium]|nr:cysteine desulfurase family protein [Chloroflexota bacterium]